MKYVHVVSVIALLMCWGCAADPYARYGLGEATDVVGSSVDALGGADRMLSSGPTHADAIVTIHDESGTAFINKHHQVYNLSAGTLAADARLPEGAWNAHASNTSAGFDAIGALDRARHAPLLAALQLCQHRVRGPINLMNVSGSGEIAGKPERVRLPGMNLFRVPVTGGANDVKAYYFDAQTYLLRLVTAGGDAPGQKGTVTVYSYRLAPSGKAFPSRLEVLKLGQHVLVGNEPVLEVDFRNVRF